MNSLRRFLLIASSALMLSQAVAAQQTVSLNIQAQPLADALASFAQQAGLQMIVPTDIAKDLMAPAVSGAYTAEGALKELLSKSALEYQFINARTVAIRGIKVTSVKVDEQHLAQAEAARGEGGGDNPTESAAAASLEAGRSNIEEIIVTAQKRAERLQDVPISISVLGGDILDHSNLQGSTEALTRIPGVAINTGSLNTYQVTIRGVAAAANTQSGSSVAGYYLDGVPFGFNRNALTPDAGVYDLERIEVLRGPQGTLYGASALAGVVRILTANPDLKKFQFKAKGGVSQTNEGDVNYRGDAMANIPLISDKLALRVVAGIQDLSGWLDKPTREDANNADIENFRAKLGFNPMERLDVVASAWMSRTDYGSQNIGRADFTMRAPDLDQMSSEYDVQSLHATYDFDGFSITSATSHINYAIASYLSYMPVGLNGRQLSRYNSAVFAEELTASSTAKGPFRWTLGGMYRDGEDRYRRDFDQTLPFTNNQLDFSDVSESIALFGEITSVLLNERLELTAGLRYFQDDVENHESVSFTNNPASALLRADASFEAVTPRAVVTYHPSRDFTYYASYSQGFRSGVNQLPQTLSLAPNIAPIKADKLSNYEVGGKGEILNGLVSVDGAVYYIDWKDIQQGRSVSILGNGLPPQTNALVNAGSANGPGVDLSVGLHPARGLELSASVSLNKLEFDQSITDCSGNVCRPYLRKGDRPAASPERTINASISYAFPIGVNGIQGELSAAVDHSSPFFLPVLVAGNYVPTESDSFTNVRSSFDLKFNDWSLALFVDNLSDQNPVRLPAPAFPDWEVRVRPRTVGVQFEYRL